MKTFSQEPRERSNPIFGPNRLKLGIFGINGTGTVMTEHPDRFVPTWEASLRVAQACDAAGFEAIVPYSRWKPFGPAGHATGITLDTFAWAAGISALTTYSSIFSTCHATSIHPLVAAKQGATIDHISGGRFTLNVVVGWYTPEVETFGIKAGDHEQRYAQAEEWLVAVKRLWTENTEVDVDGDYIRMQGGVSTPKPVQLPAPPIMNAGGSDRGRAFAAEHADIAFMGVRSDDPEQISQQVASYKQYAKDEYDRTIQVWGYCVIIQAATSEEADALYEDYVIRHPDDSSIDIFLEYQVKNRALDMPADAVAKLRQTVAAGGGLRVMGTPDMIADKLELLSNCGMNGILLTFVDYVTGAETFIETVLPLLEQRGLRKPHLT